MLVLRFHCTLATPEPLSDLFQSTISTHNRTQTKVLAVYNGIRNSINTKLVGFSFFFYKMYILVFAKIAFHLIIYKRQRFQEPSDLLVQQSNHQT